MVRPSTADGTNTVTYDATGNRNNGSNTTGAGNQLTSDGTWDYTYDLEGNLIEKNYVGTDEKWTFAHDNQNRLIEVKHYNAASTLVLDADYKYDVFGNRIEKSVNAGSAVVTRFAVGEKRGHPNLFLLHVLIFRSTSKNEDGVSLAFLGRYENRSKTALIHGICRIHVKA